MKQNCILSFLSLILCGTGTLIAQTDWRTTGNDSEPGRFLGTIDNMPLVFKTNNVERIRLTQAGKFGIGTTAPLELLDVNGNVRINGLLKLAAYIDATETQKRFLYVTNQGTTSLLKNTAMTDAMYSHQQCVPKGEDGTGYPAPVWTNSGGVNYGVLFTGEFCPARVGIGTDNPDATLDVQGDQFITDKLEIGGQMNHDCRLLLRPVNQEGLLIYQNNTDGLEHMAIEVHRMETGNKVFKLSDRGAVSIIYEGNPTDEMFRIGDATGQDIFNITSTGHVYSTGVVVKEAPFFPDYVFDEGYDLMSLYELEVFIEEHGKLPGMPTAEEVEENGADLYELTRLLTEKVEELTLYTIAQQKEIEGLKAQLKMSEPETHKEVEKK